MMRTLLIFHDATGTRSSRKIRQRCEQDVACRVFACHVFVGEDAPDFHAISEFRRRHVAAFETLFVGCSRGLVVMVLSPRPGSAGRG